MDERKEKKLYGIVEAVVKSVKNGTIDIHHVFTREYAKNFVDVDDLDSRYEAVKDWIDSMPYILSIKEKNWGKVFGTVKLADMDYWVHGAEVACFVVKNISADFYIDGDTFLHSELMNRKGKISNILFTPEAFWDGWKENFMYCADGREDILQFFATSNLKAEDDDWDDPNQGTDLMRLEEVFQCWEDEDTYTKPLGIYGFMASLINAVFKDAIRRRIFNIDWYNPNWAIVVACTAPHMKIIMNQDLPKRLHVPGQYVFEAYMKKALPALRQKLEFDDEEFEPEESYSYTLRKMLKIEVEQSWVYDESELWNAFPVEVQNQLQKYHELFIKWLRKKVGDDETKETKVKDPKEIHYHIAGNVGQQIGNVEQMNSNKDERE